MVSSLADSTRSRQATLDPGKLFQRLRDGYPCANTCWVAFSGGMDSTVLLTALVEGRVDLPFPLKAVHVDHGLQPASSDWSAHCADVCHSLGIPLSCLRVDARPRRGESPEAAARAARYAAMEKLMGDGDLLLTAHHRDDQAETVLLQLLRAAGVAGLAAMPALKRFGAGWHGRPLLDLPRSALQRWAEAHSLKWIEDPSNALIDADRN
jgi:tRNA(Ile)-lysidine synthase